MALLPLDTGIGSEGWRIVNEERLVKIETKLAYLENTVQELNDVICSQQKQIDRLETTCRLLVERIRHFSELSDAGKLIDEKPPHY